MVDGWEVQIYGPNKCCIPPLIFRTIELAMVQWDQGMDQWMVNGGINGKSDFSPIKEKK